MYFLAIVWTWAVLIAAAMAFDSLLIAAGFWFVSHIPAYMVVDKLNGKGWMNWTKPVEKGNHEG